MKRVNDNYTLFVLNKFKNMQDQFLNEEHYDQFLELTKLLKLGKGFNNKIFLLFCLSIDKITLEILYSFYNNLENKLTDIKLENHHTYTVFIRYVYKVFTLKSIVSANDTTNFIEALELVKNKIIKDKRLKIREKSALSKGIELYLSFEKYEKKRARVRTGSRTAKVFFSEDEYANFSKLIQINNITNESAFIKSKIFNSSATILTNDEIIFYTKNLEKVNEILLVLKKDELFGNKELISLLKMSKKTLKKLLNID